MYCVIDFASTQNILKKLYPSSSSELGEPGRISNNHNRMRNCDNMCVRSIKKSNNGVKITKYNFVKDFHQFSHCTQCCTHISTGTGSLKRYAESSGAGHFIMLTGNWKTHQHKHRSSYSVPQRCMTSAELCGEVKNRCAFVPENALLMSIMKSTDCSKGDNIVTKTGLRQTHGLVTGFWHTSL